MSGGAMPLTGAAELGCERPAQPETAETLTRNVPQWPEGGFPRTSRSRRFKSCRSDFSDSTMSLTGRTRPPHEHTGGESINGPDAGAHRTGHMCSECHAPMVTDYVDTWCSGCGILIDP